jgi:cell division GTPase FtsZ
MHAKDRGVDRFQRRSTNSSRGSRSTQEAIKEIRDHLTGAHMLFVTAGMGGGTGTGAAPVIAENSA